jgi:CRISPR/Cas system-associated protein Cas10 (large subunit of type III CRISPR-Cas system)
MKLKQIIREKFRNDVISRDNHRCKVCGDSISKLDAHHITDRNEMPNGGYVKENGITLCDKENGCHMKAETFHISEGKDWVEGFHPLDLYKLIKSNLGLAIQKSKQL